MLRRKLGVCVRLHCYISKDPVIAQFAHVLLSTILRARREDEKRLER